MDANLNAQLQFECEHCCQKYRNPISSLKLNEKLYLGAHLAATPNLSTHIPLQHLVTDMCKISQSLEK